MSRTLAALTMAMSIVVVEAIAGYQTETLPRVRSHSPLITAAITDGVERSPTFRRLIETIDATDGLVYVDEGSCRRVRACLVLSVTISGPFRLLRILVEPRRARGCELIESIGHELQHAIEVLRHPEIRSDAHIYSFFDLVGRTGSERFETEEAIRAGSAVGAEVRRGEKQR